MKLYECVKDNEWGENSDLIGMKKTIADWRLWAINDRKSLKDVDNYIWFVETEDEDVIERVSWFYNIELVEVEK